MRAEPLTSLHQIVEERADPKSAELSNDMLPVSMAPAQIAGFAARTMAPYI